MTVPLVIELQSDVNPELRDSVSVVFASVAAIYRSQLGVKLLLKEIKVWENDPYSHGSPAERIGNAAEKHFASNEDHLCVIIGAAKGGYAYLGRKDGVIYTGIEQLDRMAWVMTHEIGHALGVPHSAAEGCESVIAPRGYTGSPCNYIYPLKFKEKEKTVLLDFMNQDCGNLQDEEIIVRN